MSRPSKATAKGPALAKTDAPNPAQVTPVTPVTTDAASATASAAAEAAAASVDPKTDAPPVPPVTPPVTPPAPPAEAKTKKTAQPVVLQVKGPTKGRWRAGRHFTPEPVDIPMADLSDEDLLKLKGDPELTCTVIGAPA